MAASDKPTTPATTPSDRADHAVILGGNRIPFAKAGGAYRNASNQDMLTAALDGLVARFGLSGEKVDEVVAGGVLKHSRDFNLTRESVLGTALDPHTPAFDLQQACATGVEAAITIANKVRLGQVQVGIAGGVDSISDAPIALNDRLRRTLLAASRTKTLPQRLKTFARLRPTDLAPAQPRTDEPRTGLSMGEHQAITTAEWKISRQAQDELALASHQNLAQAWDQGFFNDLVTPFHGLQKDDILRPDTSLEKLGALKPVFGKALDTPPTMTAGNSTGLTDGASAVLISAESWARAHGIKPLAKIIDAQTAATDFVNGSEGLLMAPARAVPELLARNNLNLADIDLFEIHEAFASTVLTTLAAWEDEAFCTEVLGLAGALGKLDRSKLNVNGSSLATGHPFAATGGRILASTAKLLAQRGGGRALVSVCAAGGLGVAVLLEGCK